MRVRVRVMVRVRARGRGSSYLVDGGDARERRPRATWLML